MRVRTHDPAAELSLNLAPMIDVVFLLLIFFMVATTFAQQEKEMSLDLPTAESGDEAQNNPEEIVINLLSDGRMRVMGEDVAEEALESMLVRAARSNPETPVTIRGDRDVVLQRVVSVMDACRRAGLTDIGIVHEDA